MTGGKCALRDTAVTGNGSLSFVVEHVVPTCRADLTTRELRPRLHVPQHEQGRRITFSCSSSGGS